MRLWDEVSNLWLFTVEEFNQIPDGTELTCITGRHATKGAEYIDLDTRYGHIAYGVVNPLNHPLKHLFLIFGLKQ